MEKEQTWCKQMSHKEGTTNSGHKSMGMWKCVQVVLGTETKGSGRYLLSL